MKWTTDDGEVIEEFPDGTAIVAVTPDMRIASVLELPPDDDDEVPANAVLAGACAPFLNDPANAEYVLRWMNSSSKHSRH